MTRGTFGWGGLALGMVIGCTPPSGSAAGSATAAATSAAPAAAADAAPAPATASLPAGATACPSAANVTCLRFDTPEAAFRYAIASDPLVLAIGEAHAQKGTENIPSATKRFTDAMVPVLGDRASDLLLEAWAGDPRCQKEVKTVASAQAPVKQAQAETNGNEYVAMGTRAKAAGIQPHLLRPSCDEYAGLADAGADVITASLGLIKRLTQADATTLYQRNLAAKNGKLVVTYGGAMHNDLAPDNKMRAYSFGPELLAATGGRYVELDLIVPEYVKKNEVWEKLPWFAAFQADTAPRDKTSLYRLGDKSFVLVFPATPAK